MGSSRWRRQRVRKAELARRKSRKSNEIALAESLDARRRKADAEMLLANSKKVSHEGHITGFATTYDTGYCLTCDAWLSNNCGDEKCEYCASRPEKPSAAIKLGVFIHGE